MTFKDYIQSEAENVNRICLYQEGLFWKAYERSAYLLCTQVHPFKPTKKTAKSLGGDEIVSVGFPVNREEHYTDGLERISAAEKRLVLRAREEIDVTAFKAWKNAVPASADAPSRSEGGARTHTDGRADIPADDSVQARIRAFNLAESTPMDCMFFVCELKKMV